MKNTIIVLLPLLYCLLACNASKDTNSYNEKINKRLVDRTIASHFAFGDSISSKLSVALDSVEMNFIIDTLGQGVYLQVHRVVINSDRNKAMGVYTKVNKEDSIASDTQCHFAQKHSTKVDAGADSSQWWIVLGVVLMIVLIILKIKLK